ncbi:hypothetical protein CERSUDRAFT_111262 [Gelatoporia subvermispora B]|uniref:Uncharacterized protein n=1 Tax=Ceriporiopsis subvermispora (strain B) TaxID=914234 RepID=M2RP88_CERS8|nr:hypothetical protein CERSUDRAFT_111262 [Gelatoporia subvermispora B]
MRTDFQYCHDRHILVRRHFGRCRKQQAGLLTRRREQRERDREASIIAESINEFDHLHRNIEASGRQAARDIVKQRHHPGRCTPRTKMLCVLGWQRTDTAQEHL